MRQHKKIVGPQMSKSTLGKDKWTLEAEAMSTIRWLPRHGDPETKTERVMQQLVKIVAFLPVYTAIVVTLTLLVLVFGVPFLGGSP
jgi:hypothetical protein